MAQAIYGGAAAIFGQIYYGQNPQLNFSAKPMWARPYLNYGQVRVYWSNPVPVAGQDYVGIRLVRSYDQYPEHAEDGTILLDVRGTNAPLNSFGYFDDVGIPGQFVYYRIFLLMGAGFTQAPFEWFDAGTAYCLMPAAHDTKTPRTAYKSVSYSNALTDNRIPQTSLLSTHDKFMALIPAIFQYQSGNGTITNAPTPTQNNDNTLSTFLKGFSLTLDDLLTYADTTKPDASGRTLNPSVVDVKSYQLGLPLDPNGSTKQQKKVIRNAIYTYSRKGTKAGLQRFVEDTTGNSASITVGANLMLSIQDASFYNGVGFWVASAGATIAQDYFSPMAVGSDESVYDTTYTGKIVVTSANATVANGLDSPITKGIPVTASTAYDYVFNYFAPSNFGWSVAWYDVRGNQISTTTGTLTVTANTWTKASVSFTSPASAVTAVLSYNFPTTGTYYLDRIAFMLDVASPAYTEPRMVSIFLNPVKTNYITNPSFEVNTTNWGATVSISSVTAGPSEITASPYLPSSTNILKATLSTAATTVICTTDTITATAGNYYTFSVYSATKTPNNAQIIGLGLRASLSVTMASSQVSGGGGTAWFVDGHPFQIGDQINFTGGLGGYPWTVNAVTASSISFPTSLQITGGNNNTSSTTVTMTRSAPANMTGWSVYSGATLLGLVVSYIGTTLTLDTAQAIPNGTQLTFALPSYAKQVDTNTATITTTAYNSGSIVPSSTWTRSSATNFIPANWASTSSTYSAITLQARIFSSANAANGVVYFDAAQLEPSIVATDYFDGSLSNQDAKWAGTAHSSISYIYPNRTKRLARLTYSVANYLPANTPYIIGDYVNSGVMQLS